ncbi:MAG TPA: GDSL-type esterase/lipase family protein [Planctomycetota bacterium]|nr:GDSL-type esterase/lipase family protein [Planctomycetota bacterium]
MLKNYLGRIGALALLAGAFLAYADAAESGGVKPPAPTDEPKPYLLKPEGQQFTLLKNWTFGNTRPDATVRNKADLDQEFYYRYIWENGTLDKFKTYWSYHRDYPEGDAKSLHVFSDNTLTLKGRIPDGGGLRERGIESGMLRGKIPVTPGMYIEMRAKLTGGVGVWPNFWLEEGVQYPDGTFSKPPKALPEIDIFEFFNWDGRPQTRIMVCNIQTFGGAAAYGNPHDIFTTLKDVGYERNLDVGFDCSKEFHVFALDWVENKPIWLLDGKPIKQTYYEWHGPPAHVVVANSIGLNLPGMKQTEMKADEKQWDYVIDYIRIWEHKQPAMVLNSFENTGGRLTIAAAGKWESPVLSAATSDAAKLKANPRLKADITVPPDAADAGWFMVKLAINGEGIARTESPDWLLDRCPGKAGIDKFTLSWDASEIAAKLPANPNWFKIEMVTQGDHPRTIHVSNLRVEAVSGPASTPEPKAEAPQPAAAGPTPYPDKDQDWPGKGVIRKFGFMVGERKAFWTRRQMDQGAVVFVGDSLTGGWKNLEKDFPKLKVANRGVGGDVSRGALFRFKEDALDLNPKAVVIEIGNNDLTAMGSPGDMLSNLADMLALAEKDRPGMSVVLCTIPPSANPAAPVKAEDRKAMNEGIRKLAAEHKHAYFCDLFAALAHADGSPKLDYFAADKLHLNDAGHGKWAELLTPIFVELKLR